MIYSWINWSVFKGSNILTKWISKNKNISLLINVKIIIKGTKVEGTKYTKLIMPLMHFIAIKKWGPFSMAHLASYFFKLLFFIYMLKFMRLIFKCNPNCITTCRSLKEETFVVGLYIFSKHWLEVWFDEWFFFTLWWVHLLPYAMLTLGHSLKG